MLPVKRLIKFLFEKIPSLNSLETLRHSKMTLSTEILVKLLFPSSSELNILTKTLTQSNSHKVLVIDCFRHSNNGRVSLNSLIAIYNEKTKIH